MARLVKNNTYNIAVVGAGLSGITAAWLLGKSHRVTLFEADNFLDAHGSRVEIPSPNGPIAVGGSFVIFNNYNYPHLNALFTHNSIPVKTADLSVSVSLENGRWEFRGGDAHSLLTEPANFMRPCLWAMLSDLRRFRLTAAKDLGMLGGMKLSEYLAKERYGQAFQDRYLLPMIAALWAVSPQILLNYPADIFLNFCADTGFLKTRPASIWQTVEGGGSVYGNKLLQKSNCEVHLNTRIEKVKRIREGIQIRDQHGGEGVFDHVVLATHADTALRLMEDPSDSEYALLKSFQYRQNTALMHLDRNLMPKKQMLWSGSNYIERNPGRKSSKNFCVTFWMNRLQGLSGVQNIFITIDPEKPIPKEKILHRQINRRPILDKAAIAAQNQIEFLQGHRNTWFCGGYFGLGFHEDSVEAGLSVAEKIGPLQRPWHVEQRQPDSLAFA